jgi:uncharacterized protein YecE (DUF72 family)
MNGDIRVGIGGWDYDPWRETYYPPDLPKKQHLEYSSRQLTAIEVNSTFYRMQKPEVLAKWREATPENFVFTLKAPRYIVERKELASAGNGVTRFMEGLSEILPKLGAILWQLPPGSFNPSDVEQFLQLLPAELQGQRLRHALEVKSASYKKPEFIELARRYNAATVFVDSETAPRFADITADFVYARLKNTVSSEPTGYSSAALQAWTERALQWSRGMRPEDLPYLVAPTPITAPPSARDVFLFFIAGAKERAPAAALQLIKNLKEHAAH